MRVWVAVAARCLPPHVAICMLLGAAATRHVPHLRPRPRPHLARVQGGCSCLDCCRMHLLADEGWCESCAATIDSLAHRPCLPIELGADRPAISSTTCPQLQAQICAWGSLLLSLCGVASAKTGQGDLKQVRRRIRTLLAFVLRRCRFQVQQPVRSPPVHLDNPPVRRLCPPSRLPALDCSAATYSR